MNTSRMRMSIFASLAVGLVTVSYTAAQGQGGNETASARVLQRIDHLLQPSTQVAAGSLSTPVRWPGARAVEDPQARLSAYQGTPPSPPVHASARPTRPRGIPEASPPVGDGKPPAPPKPMQMPVSPLIQLPPVDVETPLPLPILARPKADRAALDDTTLETSQAAALHPVRPRRTQPVPFAPLNLPDPFEHARAGGVRNPPEENPNPPPTPIRTPKQ